LIAFHQPEHPVSHQYRSLVANLAGQEPDTQIQVLLFTALSPRVGTTTVLLNVAITAAREEARVAVVDANLRHPALAKLLGLPPAPGLREILNGTASLRSAIQETGQPNLFAMSAGADDPDEANHSSASIMRAVLHQLRDRFELVLVDAPCWESQPELIALGPVCDAVYLVLDQAQAGSAEARALYQMIPQQGGRLAGCILAQR
jgi:Mrp family chromosome partitioning ATPase